MKIYLVSLLCLLVSGAWGFPESHSSEEEEEEEDSHEVSLLDIHNELMMIAVRVKHRLDENLGELREITEHVNGKKLDRILDLVQSVATNQKYFKVCVIDENDCGEHGTCEVSEDGETYRCQCQEGYAGEHCELSAPCHVELYNIQQQPPLLGAWNPICDEDGTYAGMQLQGSVAYCVTSDNVEITGYSANIGDSEHMNCQCARDEVTFARAYNCLPNGNYPQTACDEEQCWCQDSQGRPYGDPVPVGNLDTPLEC